MMAELPTQPPIPPNGDLQHFWLAVAALLVYAAIALAFAYHPPKLPGDQTGSVLQTGENLVIMAFVFWFTRRS